MKGIDRCCPLSYIGSKIEVEDRGAGAWENRGQEGYGRRESKGREAGVMRGREAGEKYKTLTLFIYFQ